jgi:hypothetical protein
MTDLATLSDVEATLGRDFTDAEENRMPRLLRDASASVRNYMRQDITLATSTVRLRIRNGRIRLPQRPVIAVTSVATVGGGPLMFSSWEGFDTITVSNSMLDTFAWEPFRNGIAVADVTYTHGWSPVPDAIVGVVCSIVSRALGRNPADAGMTQESIQGYSYQLGSAGAAGAFGMLQAERDILDTYARVGGRVNVGPGLIT